VSTSASHGLRQVRLLHADRSAAALLLEVKKHLLWLLQEIPLGEAEQPAVEDGITAYEDLLSKLVDGREERVPSE
jgi:hypothetical protein